MKRSDGNCYPGWKKCSNMFNQQWTHINTPPNQFNVIKLAHNSNWISRLMREIDGKGWKCLNSWKREQHTVQMDVQQPGRICVLAGMIANGNLPYGWMWTTNFVLQILRFASYPTVWFQTKSLFGTGSFGEQQTFWYPGKGTWFKDRQTIVIANW